MSCLLLHLFFLYISRHFLSLYFLLYCLQVGLLHSLSCLLPGQVRDSLKLYSESGIVLLIGKEEEDNFLFCTVLCCLLAQGKKINLENLNFKENGEQLRLLLGHEFFPHLPTRELFLNHFSNLHFYVQELSFLACCTFMPCSTFYIYFFLLLKKMKL